MPTWGIHLTIANRLINKLNVITNEEQKNEFIFANILPDINNGYVVKGIQNILPHKTTHFEIKEYTGNYGDKPGYINFYEEYKNELYNPIILGYYIHLMTDFYFNNVTYTEYGIFDENNNRIGIKLNTGEKLIIEKENVREMKQNDFKIFAYYLYKNEYIQIPKYSENIEKQIKKIKEINVNKNDINKTIEYIKDCTENPSMILDIKKDNDYKIYTNQELKKRIDMCIDVILEDINSKYII